MADSVVQSEVQSRARVERDDAPKGVKFQRAVFKTLGRIGVGVGFLLFLLTLFVIPPGWSVLGMFLLVVGVICLGVWIVPEPEIWIRLRWGKRLDALHPGFHLIVPFIDSIGKKSRPFERVMDIIPLPKGELPKIQASDGILYFRDYIMTLVIGSDFQNIVNAVYGVQDWVDWIRNKLNSLVVGYVTTLTIVEATDEGMLRDNILDRIREAAEVVRAKIVEKRKRREEVFAVIQASDSTPDTSNPELEELDKAIERLTLLPALYEKIASELKNLIEVEAPARGIVEIKGVFCGALKLSPDTEKAREKVRVAKLEAEAALHNAIAAGAELIGPVLAMKEKLQEAGMKDEGAAMDTALAFELAKKLSDGGGAWALALPRADGNQEGPLGTIQALITKLLQAAAITTPPKATNKEPGL